jgi:hypothetical protein
MVRVFSWLVLTEAQKRNHELTLTNTNKNLNRSLLSPAQRNCQATLPLGTVRERFYERAVKKKVPPKPPRVLAASHSTHPKPLNAHQHTSC